jgi:CelD/BcsL family acetyltransferase involved in cellulose biosynthesis
MTIALRRLPADPGPRTTARPYGTCIARVEIFDDMRRVEPLWRALQAQDALATPYQNFDFLAPWCREVGSRNRIVPAVLTGFDVAGEPVLVWPLGRRRNGPVVVAEFLGGKHANFNMPLWRRDLVAAIGPDDLRAVLAAASGIDLVSLHNQPERWDGIANPLLRLPHQPAPSFGQRGALMADFEELLRARLNSRARKKLRKKERVLASHGALRFWRAQNETEARRILDVFFAQKALRMRRLGIVNAFEGPGVREFITAAATERLASGRPAIELYACTVGDTVVATFAGLVGGQRFCGLFNSMILNALAHESPGEALLVNVVRMSCERGLAVFDLGVGEAEYKEIFCAQPEPLFDSFLPLTPRGRAVAFGERWRGRVKRLVKQNAALWGTVDWARRIRAGWSSAQA